MKRHLNQAFISMNFALVLILLTACSNLLSTDTSGIALKTGSTINFSDDITGGFENGWSYSPEPGGIWSVKDESFLKFRYSEKYENGLKLDITMKAFVNSKNPNVSLVLTANGVEVKKVDFDEKNSDGEYAVVVPPEVMAIYPGEILLNFQITGAASPKELGVSEDIRKLGVFLIKITPNGI